MATNSSVKKIITIEVQGNQATASIDNVTVSTKQLNTELKNLSLAAGKSKPKGNATGGATATVLELGRTISDSNYGIRGMANNLSQLVSNLVFTTKAAGGFAAGLKSIWSALMGPLGLVLAGQALIAMLERFDIEANKSKRAAEGLSDAFEENSTQAEAYLNVLNSIVLTEKDRQVVLGQISSLSAEYSKLIKENEGDIDDLRESIMDYVKVQKLKLRLDELVNRELERMSKFQQLNKVLQSGDTDAIKSQIYESMTLLEELRMAFSGDNLLFKDSQEVKDFFIKNLMNPLYKEGEYLKPEIDRIIKEIASLQDLDTEDGGGGGDEDDSEDKGFGVLHSIFGGNVESLLKGYDKLESLAFDLQRKRLATRKLYHDEAKIQASLDNNQILRGEIEHKEKMLNTTQMSSLERLQAENELSMMRISLQDQEFEHEMLLLDLRMQAQLEYVEFVSGLGQVFSTLGKESEALATIGLVVQKGAAVAGVVIEAQQANAKILSASATEVGFYKVAAAATALNPFASELYAGKAIAAEAGAAKRIAKNNIGAGIAIANILATTLTSRTAPSGGGRAGGGAGGGGGRTFDFNLVGSTGTNQLAEAVGGQFQEPIQAYVVSNEITSQQELDLQIQTGASLGD